MYATIDDKEKLSKALGINLKALTIEKTKELNAAIAELAIEYNTSTSVLQKRTFTINRFDIDILSSLECDIKFINLDFQCEVKGTLNDFARRLTFKHCDFGDSFLLGGRIFSSIELKTSRLDIQNQTFCNISIEELKLIHIDSIGFEGVRFDEIGKFEMLLNNSKINKLIITGKKLYLEGATFENGMIYSQDLQETNELIFNKCIFKYIDLNSIYNDRVSSKSRGFPKARFNQCQFQSDIIIEKNINNLYLDSCKFHANFIARNLTIEFQYEILNPIFLSKVDFSNSIFETDVTFHKSKFNAQVNFQGVMFQGNAYFSESIFAEKANFSRGKFEKTAGFYGTTFEKVPNFSQAIFNGNVNLVNAKLNFRFKDVKKKIKEEYSNHIGTEKEKFLDKFANDFRDSFRLFKNALIKENNLLDAANHHRIELYCKEIELESKKPKIFSRDWIDKWVLKFYRHTSDHHTDLLKIWHSLLIVVGIFGILSSGVIVAFDYGYLKFCDFSAHSLIEMYKAHINHFVLTHSYEMLGMNALLFMLFIGLFMLGVLWDRARVIGICFSYCVMIFLFAASPKYLIPAIGIFTDKRSMLDPLSVIGGIYTIVFAFMLYSFIKTARKNSIIPH